MSNEIQDNVESDIKYVKWFVVAGLIMICLTLGSYFFITYIMGQTTNESRGSFGDMFGMINAVFSGLAFAGIIITILMQMKELELTRNELAKSAIAQDKSQKALQGQLTRMKTAEHLQAINNFLAFEDGDRPDEKIAAKNILNRLILKIFEEDYKELVSPFFEITVKNKNELPYNGHEILFSIKNIGIEARNLTFEADRMKFLVSYNGDFIEGYSLKNKNLSYYHAINCAILVDEIPEDVLIRVLCVDSINHNLFESIIKVQIRENSKPNFIMTPCKLIKEFKSKI